MTTPRLDTCLSVLYKRLAKTYLITNLTIQVLKSYRDHVAIPEEAYGTHPT